MANIRNLVVLTFIIASVAGHGWLSSPPSRSPDTTNSNPPCDPSTGSSPAPKNVSAGGTVPTTWITPHSGGATDIHFMLVPTASLGNAAAFKSLGSFAYSQGSATVTVPASTTPGSYVLQWSQDSPGPYYNCVDLQVTAAATTTSSSNKSGSSSGHMSGGAAFGVFLLVVILVAIVAFVGIVIFLKVKRPEKYDEYKDKIMSKLPGRH